MSTSEAKPVSVHEVESNPWVMLNGRLIRGDAASLSILDRGFIFADGVYEVIRFYDGVGLGLSEHLERLQASLYAIELHEAWDEATLRGQIAHLLEVNALSNASIYIQITRGPAMRTHHFPVDQTEPTTLLITNPTPALHDEPLNDVRTAITHPDQRWACNRIKSISLLANVLAAEQGRKQGVNDVILVRRDGTISEAPQRSIAIVEGEDLIFPPLDMTLLSGITRQLIERTAGRGRLRISHEPITVPRMMQADAVVSMSTTSHPKVIGQINGQAVGSGSRNQAMQRLQQSFVEFVVQTIHDKSK